MTTSYSVLAAHIFGLVIVLPLIVRILYRRRQARKRLVAAALAVANDWRIQKDGAYNVKYFKERCVTARVVGELIEALKHVN